MSRFARSAILLLFTTVAFATISFATIARADDVDSFLAGLDALAAGRYEDAAAALGKAAEARPSAVRHLDHGVALFMLGKSDEANDAFEKARALGDSDDLRVWSIARQMMFEPTLPDMNRLPKDDLPYSKQLLVAVLGMRSPNSEEKARARTAVTEAMRQFVEGQRGGIETVKALYGARRYPEALARLGPLLKRAPDDGVTLAYSAHCKLGMNDFAGARADYTAALRALPLDSGCYIGRARSAAMLGAIVAARADAELARRIDARQYPAQLAEVEALLAKGNASAAADPPSASRAEPYTRELTRLLLAVRTAPGDFAPLLALSDFHLQPVAPCEITLGGVLQTLRVPCGPMNVRAAEDAFARAAKLAPDHPRVVLQQARLQLAERQLDDMIKNAQKAFAQDTTDLDIAVAALHYNADAANRAIAEVKQIRSAGKFVERLNDQGRFEKFWVGPTADDYRRADELEAHAKTTRENATLALQLLQKQAKAADDPHSKFTVHMVNAYHDLWYRNLPGAIEAAESALAIEPGNEHALRFLVDACAAAKSAKAETYRAMLKEVQRY